ncbi:hypothetical protein D3C80_336320 [compost metagenome]
MHALDAAAAQGTRVVQRLQLGTGFVFDTLIEVSQLFGVGRVVGQAVGAVFEVAHQVVAELFGALLGDGRNHVDRAFPLQALDHFLDPLVALVVHDHVGLVQHQPALTLGQRRAEAGQLVDDDFGGIGAAAFIQRREVDEVQQQAGTRQVLEETDTQAGAFGSAFDQTRNVGHHEGLEATHADHAQVRHQGGEGIVGDFRLGGGHGTDEGALAGVRQPQQANVGQHLQLQLEVAGLARLALGGLARRAVGAGLEAGVAQAVPAALGHQQALTGLGQVADDFLGGGIDDGGAHRHRQDQVIALASGAVLAAAVLATLGVETAGVAVVHQGIEVGIGLHEHGAAIAPVTTVGAALLNEFFATETHQAVAAVARFYKDRYFIDEFHQDASRHGDGLRKTKHIGYREPRSIMQGFRDAETKKPRRKTGLFKRGRDQAATMLTYLRLKAPLTSNLITPSTFANRV